MEQKAEKSSMEAKMKMHGTSKNTWTDAHAMPQMGGDSAAQNTAAGSGSRPTKSVYPIMTSAPEDAHTQGRAPQGWLK